MPLDVLILSNGPGEVSTWVRPVVVALRQQLGWDRSRLRLSLVLSPCTHATGEEAAIARRYPELDRIQEARHFFPFLFWGKTAEGWDWHDRGVVLFLGGDQLFPVVIGKRLGYGIVVYAEWEARWWGWVDRFGLMSEKTLAKVPPAYRDKCIVVGDLMAEAGSGAESPALESPGSDATSPDSLEWIGLLPGSKAAKLGMGVPLMLAIAEAIQQHRPQTRFWIPVAPTLTPEALAQFADPQVNPLLDRVQGSSAVLRQDDSAALPYLQTPQGLRVELHTDFPAYDRLRHCQLCLTTVGANTAELGSLAVPMIVLLPTQQLDAMRAWDGIPGILANLPGVGATFAVWINRWLLGRLGLLAWPNIWAGEEIVPELVGELTPTQVAELVLDYLNHPQRLVAMRDRLRQVRGMPGAAQRLGQMVREVAAVPQVLDPDG